MLGKQIAVVACVAVVAAPSALAAHRPAGLYDRRADVYSGIRSDVAETIRESGFESAAAPSASWLPGDTTFSWGDAGVGVGVGAGLTALLRGRLNRRFTRA